MRSGEVGFLAIGNSLNCDSCDLCDSYESFPPYAVLLIFTYLSFFFIIFILITRITVQTVPNRQIATSPLRIFPPVRFLLLFYLFFLYAP